MSELKFEDRFRERYEIYLGKTWLKSKWRVIRAIYLPKGRCAIHWSVLTNKSSYGIIDGKTHQDINGNLAMYDSNGQLIWKINAAYWDFQFDFDGQQLLMVDDKAWDYIDLNTGEYLPEPSHTNEAPLFIPTQDQAFNQKVIEIEGHRIEFKHHVSQITPLGNNEYLVIYDQLHRVNPDMKCGLEKVNHQGECIWRVAEEGLTRQGAYSRVDFIVRFEGEYYAKTMGFGYGKLNIANGHVDLDQPLPPNEPQL